MRGEWFFVLPLLSAFIDTMAALAVLLARPGRANTDGHKPPIGLRRALSAAVVTGLVFVAKLPLLAVLGVNVFGFIHVAYVELVVMLPLVGATVLLAGMRNSSGRPFRRVSAPVRLAAAACCLPAPVGVYATFVEPFRLRVETTDVAVPAQRDGDSHIRVGILSDIQTARVTNYEREAVERLMAQRPDVILLPGDLFHADAQAFERERAALRDLLSRLNAPGGVYFVLGNVDRRADIEGLIENTRVKLLVNDTIEATVNDRRLWIGGVEMAYGSAEARAVINRLETTPGDADIRILLAHYPDVVLGLPRESRIDLVVAGHTHGGQVQIPFFGPPITLSGVPRHVAAGGYHELDGRRIHVSRGVGAERGQAPRIRFLAPPEISLLVLNDE